MWGSLVIRIDRSNVPFPHVLRRGVGSLADREFEQALEFYQNYGRNRQSGGFQFKVYRHSSVRDALNNLFNNKCAYCESVIGHTGQVDIEQFRPKGGVIGSRGEHLPLHYWWLCNEWSNLFIACIACNRMTRSGASGAHSGKGGRFPLKDEATRAPILAGPVVLEAESRLLLDPCSDDVE